MKALAKNLLARWSSELFYSEMLRELHDAFFPPQPSSLAIPSAI
jgi:hypothetical protein